MVRLKPTERLNERLRSQAARIAGNLGKATYRVRESLLSKSYHLHNIILKGECESFEDIEQNERQLQRTITEKDKEITQVLEDMAQTICTNEQTRETCLTDITNTPNYCNKGKTIEEVTPRQARRKMNTFTDYSKQALWFAESFGLVPEYTHLRKGADLSLLESCIRQQCSVSFRVWEARDPDGKPSGKYDWTSLQGEDTKKLISLLPPHFSSLLRSEICQTMANIWKVM